MKIQLALRALYVYRGWSECGTQATVHFAARDVSGAPVTIQPVEFVGKVGTRGVLGQFKRCIDVPDSVAQLSIDHIEHEDGAEVVVDVETGPREVILMNENALLKARIHEMEARQQG